MANYYVNGYLPPADVRDAAGVLAWQQKLNQQGAGLNADGVWGPKTQAAYEQYRGGETGSAGLPANVLAYAAQIRDQLLGNNEYRPADRSALQGEIASWLRPAYDAAIARRQEGTDQYQAQVDADALSRGMGSSTWVTDSKNRLQQQEMQDVQALETEYAAALGKLLYEAMEADADRQQNARQLRFDATKFALDNAMGLYQQEQAAQLKQQTAGTGKSGSKSGKSGKAVATVQSLPTEEECRTLLGLLTPAERSAVYGGWREKDQQIRAELMSVFGPEGYLVLQQEYPGA